VSQEVGFSRISELSVTWPVMCGHDTESSVVCSRFFFLSVVDLSKLFVPSLLGCCWFGNRNGLRFSAVHNKLCILSFNYPMS